MKHPGGAKYIGYLLKIRKAQRVIRRIIRTRRPTPTRKGEIDIDQLGAIYGLKRAPGETDAGFRERIYDVLMSPGKKQSHKEAAKEDIRQ